MKIPNTFGLPAEAKNYAEFGSVEQLKSLLAAHRGENILVVGQGSNLLFAGDYDGLVLRSGMKRVLSLVEDDDAVYIDCGAGIVLDELIEQVVDMGLYGLENLSYIPGTVGASAVQNVGAYGVEAKDVITEVHAVEIASGDDYVWKNEELGYGYRASKLKGEWAGRFVVTSVTYRLSKKPVANPDNRMAGKSLRETRQEIIRVRQEKLPEVSEHGSAGSYFKNPILASERAEALLAQYPDMPHWNQEGGVKLSAAWLIDHAGCKGMSVGGAKVWEKQPLVIVNDRGEATAQDILALAEQVKAAVRAKYGVELEEEVMRVEGLRG